MKKIILILCISMPLWVLAQTKPELLDAIKNNPDKVETIALIQKAGGYDPDYKELRGLFKTLSKDVRKSNQGKLFNYYLDKLEGSSVGKKAPGITQLTPEGDIFSLSDLRGQYVLIDFWASWCPDCRRQNPALVDTYAQFKGKNFEILGVSFDKNLDDWVKAIAVDKMSWKHISDLQRWNNAAGALYGVKAIPQNILVDPNGIIVARNLHGEALNAKLAELLNK